MDPKLNLDDLPPEIVVHYLLKLSLKDLINYCLTSKTANAYCQNNAFWKDKYRYDFGLPLPVLEEGEKWIEIYKERATSKNSPISVGNRHYAAIDDQGILYMGGNNNHGQLGDGTKNNSKIPIAIESFNQKIISVSCGNIFTMAITEDGKIYGWGNNPAHLEGQLLVPTLIPIPTNLKAIKVSCGEDGWGVILDDGSVYVSISIFTGVEFIETPNRVILEDKIIDISVNTSSFAAVTKSGKLYFAGENFNYAAGEKFIGIEISGNRLTIIPKHIHFPPQQGIIPKIKQVSLSETHIIALTVDGKIFVWVDNNHDPISGSNLYLSPRLLTSLSKISYISTFDDSSAAITSDGRLYIWGKNKIINASNFIPGDKRFRYDLGIYMTIVPVEISIGSRVNYIALGNSFTIATTVDGMVNNLGDNPGDSIEGVIRPTRPILMLPRRAVLTAPPQRLILRTPRMN